MKTLIRDLYRKIKYYNSTPADLRQSDVFLVEFPKSGVTWLSFILGNLMILKSKNESSINFFNFTQYVPEIHYSRTIGKTRSNFGFRIIKSHADYNPFYSHVILLIRNPFNVMLSYYKYLTALNITDKDFSAFIKDKKLGVESWVKHTQSWLSENNRGLRLQVVRYEDIAQKPLFAIKYLCDTLGISVDEDLLNKVVELSSFEKMKKKENTFSKHNPAYNLNFVRKGKTGAAKLNPDDFNFIMNKSKKLIDELWNDIDFQTLFLNEA